LLTMSDIREALEKKLPRIAVEKKYKDPARRWFYRHLGPTEKFAGSQK